MPPSVTVCDAPVTLRPIKLLQRGFVNVAFDGLSLLATQIAKSSDANVTGAALGAAEARTESNSLRLARCRCAN